MKKIVLATSNPGKINELKELLPEYDVVSYQELGLTFEVVEDQETFVGNASKKATEISKALGGVLCLADDSGLEIDVLNGFPGVHTARFYPGTDHDRNKNLLHRLEGVPKEKRMASHATVIAISNGDKTTTFEGRLTGWVTTTPRGSQGFGFDEILELETGYTLAELSLEEKNKISARKIALQKVVKHLQETGGIV